MSTRHRIIKIYREHLNYEASYVKLFFLHSHIHFGSIFFIDILLYFPLPSYCTGSCIVFVPVDVIKERLQVQHTICTHNTSSSTITSTSSSSNKLPIYKGSFDALLQICQQEGVRGIYKGYGATLLTYGPFSALYFLLYEEVSVSGPSC